MQTKIIYVLTSDIESNYCEQALISVFTARYYNTDAHIVLVVDDRTDKIFTGKRSEILKYVTEKIIVPFDEEISAMQRSRWIKTSIRKYISGDFLFVDSDTIITGSLSDVDNFNCEIGAVTESHLPVKKFNQYIYQKVDELSKKIGWKLNEEEYYFSSGVIYVKDTPLSKVFFEKWHEFWKDSCKNGLCIDQPSFAKANIALNHPIQEINGIWNCVMYTHVDFAISAKILHFCSFRNMSYIFGNEFLKKVKDQGIENNDFIKKSILYPHKSYLPFDGYVYNYKTGDFFRLITDVRHTSKGLYYHLDAYYDDYIGAKPVEQIVKKLFQRKMFLTGAILLVGYKFYRVKLNKKYRYVSNTCAAHNF